MRPRGYRTSAQVHSDSSALGMAALGWCIRWLGGGLRTARCCVCPLALSPLTLVAPRPRAPCLACVRVRMVRVVCRVCVRRLSFLFLLFSKLSILLLAVRRILKLYYYIAYIYIYYNYTITIIIYFLLLSYVIYYIYIVLDEPQRATLRPITDTDRYTTATEA